jgi:dolichol-phosphate mannosyltransferase
MDEAQRKTLVSVVIPVFNEERGIEQLHDRLATLQRLWSAVELEFVIVDDGSSDGTVNALQRTFPANGRTHIAVHAGNRGVGAAFRTGFQHCNGSIVCTIDADCTYGPENLQPMVAALIERSADIAVASPYHPEGCVEGVPGWRLALSRACSGFYWIVAPVRLYTYTSIFRAYRKRVIQSLSFEEDGFVFAAETLIRAAEQGYRIVEVPMTLRSRAIGQTKMKVLQTIRGHLRLIGRTAMRRIRIGGNGAPVLENKRETIKGSQIS